MSNLPCCSADDGGVSGDSGNDDRDDGDDKGSLSCEGKGDQAAKDDFCDKIKKGAKCGANSKCQGGGDDGDDSGNGGDAGNASSKRGNGGKQQDCKIDCSPPSGHSGAIFKFSSHQLKKAVALWGTNASCAERKYGPISDWDVSEVTSMNKCTWCL